MEKGRQFEIERLKESSKTVLASFKSFQGDGVVTIIVVTDGIEVVVALMDGQVLAPVVLDPFNDDEAAGFEGLYLVRSRAERRLQRRFGEVAFRPIVLRQNG